MDKAYQVTLARIVGNELPPRHQPGSHLEQLRFTLMHEPSSPMVKKIWILNRIVDPILQQALINELNRHHGTYHLLPFDKSGYERLAALPEGKHVFFKKPLSRRAKNLRKAGLIIAINHARNMAMQIAREFSPWVIPLDGGCCLNQEGFQQMLSCVQAPTQPFYALPTYRLKQYEQWQDFVRDKHPMHEPMLLLPTAMEKPFNEERLYGNEDKLATIRLLFPRRAIRQTRYATIVSDESYYAGYVLRLPSGVEAAEGGHKARIALREEGLARLVKQVETAIQEKEP